MSLKITYDELRREIGRFLGYSRTPGDWDAQQAQDVADVILGGCRMFYWPSLPTGSHRWSFLCKTATITLNAGVSIFSLPDDFVRLCGDITYSSNAKGRKLRQMGESEYRAKQDQDLRSGAPLYFAVQQRSSSDGYELLFYPTPSDATSLLYRYEISPPILSTDNQYHLGPATMSELLLTSCLLKADKMLNKESLSADGGLHAQNYATQLQAAIEMDKFMFLNATSAGA